MAQALKKALRVGGRLLSCFTTDHCEHSAHITAIVDDGPLEEETLSHYDITTLALSTQFG